MKASLKIITTNVSSQSKPSFLLCFDDARYLFNVPEGCQKFCFSNQFRLKKIRAIFLSRLDLDCVGGLPGMLLTLADKAPTLLKLNLIAPVGMTHLLAASRSFFMRPELKLEVNEACQAKQPQAVYNDTNISVTATRLYPTSGGSLLTAEKLDKKREREIVKDIAQKRYMLSTITSFTAGNTSPIEGLDDESNENGGEDNISTSSLCFIIKGPKVPGKFDIKRAEVVGVPKGPERSLLVKGHSITLPSGVIIKPEDCVGPEKEGFIVIILDIPSIDYIPSLVSNTSLRETLMNQQNPPVAILHNCGEGVLEDEEYKKWVKESCSNSAHNIFFSKGLHVEDKTHIESDQFLAALSSVCEKVFPPVSPDIDLPKKLPDELSSMKNSFIAKQLMELNLLPKVKFCPYLPLPVLAFPEDKSNILPIIEELNSIEDSNIYREGETVIPLGTGSMIPAKLRNVSSTWFEQTSGAVLFDCGEGTLAQLDRRFGSQNLHKELRRLKLIAISHMHGDHMIGTGSVIREWERAHDGSPPFKLHITCPRPLIDYFYEACKLNSLSISNVVFSDLKSISRMGGDDTPNILEHHEKLLRAVGLKSFQSIPVTHCHLSFAVTLEFLTGVKVSFSGDCRPSDEFSLAGRDSDLLIHEATMCDEMKAEAVKRKHSTFSEAIQVGESMKAKNILLTHVSQRFCKYLAIPTPVRTGGPTSLIGVAVDLMRIPLNEFVKMPVLNDEKISVWCGNEEEAEGGEAEVEGQDEK